MKNLVLSIVLLVMTTALFAQQQLVSNTSATKSISPKLAAFVWSQTTVDLGKVMRNHPVTHEFTFVNEGNAPLVISSVKASCGCTVTEYSKFPIPAGSKGFVSATYNAATPGVFTKTITVNANTDEGVTQLVIKGEVVE